MTQDPEAIFAAFVRNANRVGLLARTVRASTSSIPPPMRPGPGEATQVRQADAVVPLVSRIREPAPPIPEGSMNGQVPAGELDRVLSDMAVLVRHGHRDEAQRKLEALLVRYPRDLLLLRRVSEFHVQHRNPLAARELLFRLAAGLFQQGNRVGVRRALEQVLVLDPGNERATRLLGLLDRRDERTGPALVP